MTGTTALLGVLALAACGHPWAVRRVRAAGGRWRTGRVVAWWVATLLAGIALAPPVQSWAHGDARGHMTVHLLLGMYAGIGFALAAPAALALASAPPGARRRGVGLVRSRPARALAHPITAAILDIGGLWLLYATPLLAEAQSNGLVRTVVHAHLLLAGALFAWAIVGPELGRRQVGLRILVLVAAGAAHAVLAKRLALDLAWAGELGGHGGLTHSRHVEAAAQLMYYGGDIAELVLAFLLVRLLWRVPWRRGAASAPSPAPA